MLECRIFATLINCPVLISLQFSLMKILIRVIINRYSETAFAYNHYALPLRHIKILPTLSIVRLRTSYYDTSKLYIVDL